MSGLKICRICLRTEAKGYKYDHNQLKYFYEEVLALKVNSNDGLPQWFCFECAIILHKFHKFKEKCYTGQKCLKELLRKGPITYEAVYKIDRATKHLQSPLEVINVTDRVKTFSIKDVEETYVKVENSDFDFKQNNKSPVNNFSDDDCNDSNVESLIKDTLIIAHNDLNDIKNNEINIPTEPYSPVSIIVEEHKTVKLKSEDMTTAKNSKELETNKSLKEFRNKYLSDENWKKVILTEDEAVKEFREKAEDPKFVAAAFKCRDCFKGFSKKVMLNRHVQSKHNEEVGPHECRFCRIRFKWSCLLRKHIQQHYTKYECLRCHIVFHLDSSALLHEEYHTGTTKKCIHCGEEFRHITTYYTHMRTHRSAYVCVHCGASFVSGGGLRQHAGRRHAGLCESSESDGEPRQSYCERCDIQFETRRAFEEHLFHSDMHTEVVEKEEQDDAAPTKKILGKRLRTKIKNELGKRKADVSASIPVKGKRRKRIKKVHKKPSTCYQCGRHFETQAACMKHHVTEHPGTSFFAPADRYICELCGASLAPGSVAMHQNMHTHEKMHTCDTCGRQFHSTIGLKRHLVTHTGEKPYGCFLCEKRFTQSNSRKLHYNTFHLKQPYPKRSREKKKELPNKTTEQEDTCEESDSLPEPEAGQTVTVITEEGQTITDVGQTVTEVGHTVPEVGQIMEVPVVGSGNVIVQVNEGNLYIM